MKPNTRNYLLAIIVTVVVTLGFGFSRGPAAGWIAFAVTVWLLMWVGRIGKEATKLACAPYPIDKFRNDGWGGGAEYPAISSAAGEWRGVDGISFAGLIESLKLLGFEGFEFWEEIDGGGGDFLEAGEQLNAANALNKLRETSNDKGFVRVNGRQLHIVEIDKVATILRKGRCLKGW